MNDIQIFENPEFGAIRTMNIDGKPYWVALDVTKALGYKRNNDTIKRHTVGAVKCSACDKMGREREILVLPESDLYRLIVHSKLPSAKKFEKWVFEIVLPQLRITGQYTTGKDTNATAANTPQAIEPENKPSDGMDALLAEMREIKQLLLENKPETKTAGMLPDPSAIPATVYGISKEERLLKRMINSMLDLAEELCRIPRSLLLHEVYKHITLNCIDVNEIKENYLRATGLSDAPMLDAVLSDRAGRSLTMLLLMKRIHGELSAR